MFKLAIAVLALVAVGVNGRPYTEEEVFDCTGKPDGYFPDPANPAAFYSCSEGDLVAKVLCEEGHIYDGVDSCIAFWRGDSEVKEQEEELQIPQNLPQVPEYPDDDDDEEEENGAVRTTKKKIFNIEITKNIFPASIIMIGKMNREQKNK